MLNKEISEVEKELELEFESKYPLESLDYIKRKDKLIHLRAKLSTLKSAQAKFDKFVEDLDILFEKEKEYFRKTEAEMNKAILYYLADIKERIDKLSSKREEKE
jgi:hypothetical protein